MLFEVFDGHLFGQITGFGPRQRRRTAFDNLCAGQDCFQILSDFCDAVDCCAVALQREDAVHQILRVKHLLRFAEIDPNRTVVAVAQFRLHFGNLELAAQKVDGFQCVWLLFLTCTLGGVFLVALLLVGLLLARLEFQFLANLKSNHHRSRGHVVFQRFLHVAVHQRHLAVRANDEH